MQIKVEYSDKLIFNEGKCSIYSFARCLVKFYSKAAFILASLNN